MHGASSYCRWPLVVATLTPSFALRSPSSLKPEPGKMSSEEKKMASGNAGKQSKQRQLTQEQIVAGFNQLRQEQRNLATKAAELEMELNEHNLVIETLKQVDPDRKCFRMVGGVLVERTVKDVLPALTNNHEQLGRVISTLSQQVTTKGQEINAYREKHQIRVHGQEDAIGKTAEEQASKQGQGVLVANKS